MDIRQSETYIGNGRWNWSVRIDGADQELDSLGLMEWQLPKRRPPVNSGYGLPDY
jgi:hypothetical protein